MGGTTAPGAAVSPAAQPIVRSDVDLNFVNRPVAEVYRLLGQAHGVRFAVDAAVNRGATLNVNLSGLSLADVITTMAEVANHRIIQLRPSIYQVVAISEGDSLLEPPVEEENLPATEGAP
jgi:type II secretory pathway component GspD/PulD (secretin)